MQSRAVSFSAPLAGRILTGLAALFLIMDGVMKLAKPEPVVDSMIELGYPVRLTVGLGILLLTCLAIHLYPRTSALGAVLLTGYLGGAIATHLRVENGLGELTFPIIAGAMIWGGLYLRDERLRALVAPRG
jgi:hypothetical protein